MGELICLPNGMSCLRKQASSIWFPVFTGMTKERRARARLFVGETLRGLP